MTLCATLASLCALLGDPSTVLPAVQPVVTGYVRDARTGVPFPAPVPVTVELRDAHGIVDTSTVSLDGSYALRARPGALALHARAGATELTLEQIVVAGGRNRHDIATVLATPSADLLATQ